MINSIPRFVALIAFLIISCMTSTQTLAARIVVDHSSIDAQDNIIPQEWLDNARVLNVSFGHQSVGKNIIDGLSQLAQQMPARYMITIGANPSPDWFSTNKGVGQYYIGSNGDPVAKINDFAQQITLQRNNITVAMMKICYVDLGTDNPNADPAQIFAYYRDTMESLERANPDVRFVWWTEPITKWDNNAHHQYNQLVRDYSAANNKPLFDIADIESHDPAGNPIIGWDGNPAIYLGYTSDGGHLNTTGQLRAARAWWWLLARVAGWSGPTVLEMPWFTQVSGYISRFVLLNTGSSAATFNISILTESGNTAQTNSINSSGNIPANQQYVIDVNNLVDSFSAGQRAAAIITSSAPADTLTGIYNLVQPTTGAISNVALLKGQDFTSSSSTLVVPWFSTASGYNSAFIFSNYGNTDATATVGFLAPNGTTVTPKLGSLKVPAQGQLVVDTSTLVAMTGGTDGAAVFSLNASEGNVKGTYKIASALTGTANSTEMVNPQSASGSTTRLVAPWFSTAPGYTSSFILANRGSTAARYTVTVITETGNTATTATLTGSIPTGGQVILPASSIVSGFTGATRAAAIFDVSASPANIEGVYKIVSQGSGAISMTMLSRADSSGSSTTTLKLPWFSGASGYISRFVLVNTGSIDAPFTLQIYPESGNWVTQTAASGTIPAQGELVLPVSNVISGFNGATRAAAVFTVSAPAANIYGLYNIVNPTSGSISNTMMGR